jgi:Ferritin-like domain
MTGRHIDMSSDLFPSLEELDPDGALQEAGSRVDPMTRASFLRRAAAITGGVVAAGSLSAAPAFAQGGSAAGDVAILNYALTLEYLEAAFYKEAVSKGALSGELSRFAKVVAQHEAAHVQALKKALGSKAVKRPSFDFKGTTASAATFAATAKTLEDTGVEAYQGQATNIKSKAILQAAISIHPVEARHAAWVASIMGRGSGSPSPAPLAFNPALDMASVLAAVKQTGFIVTMGDATAGSAVSAQPSMTG